MSATLDQLHRLRADAGTPVTTGLADDVIAHFALLDPALVRAVAEAHAARDALPADEDAIVRGPEADALVALQRDFVNFYDEHAINPYVPLAARGPWIVTAWGAVLHDSGGYGMLGLGHGPDEVLEVLSRPDVMANIMTPSLSQRRLTEALRRELGHTREGGCPFSGFLCVNSGSESVTVAARISDIQAGLMTGPGGRHEGRNVRFLAIEGGFHGRTDRPAQASGSTRARYRQHLASFRGRDFVDLVPANDVAALHAAFDRADADGIFYEMMLMEPVMGEGSPGTAATRAFYDAARARTRKMGTLLLVDSIQAGLRTHGVLSIVDYPGFADAEAPDLETWSKALNAGQFPLSVLGMNDVAAALYRRGVYGNTMTGNPRGAEAAVATLARITPAVRANIVARGEQLLDGLRALQREFPDLITGVQGTGLLLAAEIHPSVPVVGEDGLELWCRRHGLGVIHGGKNALRFTPHFRITEEEVRLMLDLVRAGLRHKLAAAAGHVAAR